MGKLDVLAHAVTLYDHYGAPLDVIAAGAEGALLVDASPTPFRPGRGPYMRLGCQVGGNDHFLLVEVIPAAVLAGSPNKVLVRWVAFAGTSVPATVGFVQRAFGFTLHPDHVTLTARHVGSEGVNQRARIKTPAPAPTVERARQTQPWGVVETTPRSPRPTGKQRASRTPAPHRSRRTPSAPQQRPPLGPTQVPRQGPSSSGRIKTTPPARPGWRSTPSPEGS